MYTAAEKLEQLITETHVHRGAHCENPADHIFEEDELEVILHEWKEDYQQWMRPEKLEKTWSMNPQEWHQFLRRAFRSHLFQFVGSYEMVVFFLVAPFNADNLEIFRYFSDWDAPTVPIEKQKTVALEWSQNDVRSRN